MKEVIIDAKNVRKIYKVSKRRKTLFGNIANIFVPQYTHISAVEDISFSIRKGEAVGFIGPNGAGKSTVIKILSGVLYPDAGEVDCMGYIPYRQREKYVARIGVVFGQKSQLVWDLPLVDSFELLKKVYQIDNQTYFDNLEQFGNILDLKTFINQPVRQLSLGQRMRGEITAALLHSPDLVFFDEPTIGLDVLAKERVRNFIKYLNRERGTTILFTSHDMQDLESICDRLILIDKGKLVYDGDKKGLLEHYSIQKKLVVEFGELYENVKLSNYRFIEKDKFRKEIYVTNLCETPHIISDLITKYKVKDILIEDVDIEQVIKQIYKKGIE